MAEAFQPRYIDKTELSLFGLPSATLQPDIMALVDGASTLIDEECGRMDGDGNGSLCYTTYSHRILLPEGRNLFRVFFKPMAAVSTDTWNQLAASGGQFFTGFTPNTIFKADGVTLSPILSASGRYGYARRGQSQVYPDLNYGANILQIAAFFGGPPSWTAIDVGFIDFDAQTGECWVPAGLYMSQYSEIVITYNSGFDPRVVPRGLKHATAALVKNMMAMGGGATNLKSLTAGRVGGAFGDDLIDKTVERWLRPYRTVIAY